MPRIIKKCVQDSGYISLDKGLLYFVYYCMYAGEVR